MVNFIRYCCDKGLHNFMDFKIERKSRIVMKEHFVSNKDITLYDIAPYVQPDKFGRYKIPKFLLRKLSNLISDCMNGYIHVNKIYGVTRRRFTIEEIPDMLLNPNDEVKYILNQIQDDLDKDQVRNRAIKIWNIKRKMKQYE